MVWSAHTISKQAVQKSREKYVQWESVDKFHDQAMPTLIDRFRYGEIMFVQDLHERVFLDRGQPRHVHPTRRLSLFQVVAFRLDRSERHSTESVNLHNHLSFVVVRYDVNIFVERERERRGHVSQSTGKRGIEGKGKTYQILYQYRFDSRHCKSYPSLRTSYTPRNRIHHTSTYIPHLNGIVAR